jgi:serine/threonine-protein kinase RsbW
MSRGEALNESYPAVPEAVPLARRALAAVATAAGAAGDRLDEIRLAVSEALTNAVVHAYRGDEAGRLHVTAAVAADELWVLIGDDGRGLHAWNDSQGLGIGLSLISGLSDGFSIVTRASGFLPSTAGCSHGREHVPRRQAPARAAPIRRPA